MGGELLTSDERVREVCDFAIRRSVREAANTYSLDEDTVRRYIRKYDRELDGNARRKRLLVEIGKSYTDTELEAIASGIRGVDIHDIPPIRFDGDEKLFGVIGDTHIGSVYFHPEYLLSAFEEFRRLGIDTVLHVGDVTEGMSNRQGHVYECTHIGYRAQRDYAVELLDEWEGEMYFIDGNHDRWYQHSNGAVIVEDICGKLGDRAHFLGQDEGNLQWGDVEIRLWHGGDGSSYATSYRIQKIIESLTGGDKPNVLLCGHTHKQGYFFERNVHAISCGAIMSQSRWMRGKKLANHTGFHTLRLVQRDGGVSQCSPTFYPFY